MSTKEEAQNRQKILEQQKECQLAKAKAHINKLKEIDKTRPQYPQSQADKEKIIEGNSILANARKAKEAELDAAKDMEALLKYAKVVTIRDIQKQEHKDMEKAYKQKEEKLDLMMELERLKELKFQQEREHALKVERYKGARVIVDQIKEKEIRRLKEQEAKEQEGELMKRQIKLLQEEDQRNEEKKRLENERMAKEIENINKISALNRDKKKLKEKEEDLARLKYNMEKAKKEEELIAEKKRIQAEKEKETQKLREKQEKFADKQAMLDELRAKRAFEEEERKAREKELQELIKLEKQKKELIEGNEIQKIAKQKRLEEQALQDQKEYEYIIKKQLEDMEEERRMEEEKQKINYRNGADVKKQIADKAEKEKLKKRAVLEEGREIKQKLDEYKRTVERIKREKLAEMDKYHIEPKYRVDLEKYKI